MRSESERVEGDLEERVEGMRKERGWTRWGGGRRRRGKTE